MTSNDHDQTIVDRHSRTVRRAYTPLALSADQRRRHHALLDQAARQRETGQLRAHLTEAATIATIALLIIAGLVIWQALQPEDEEQAVAPAASVESTTPSDSKIDDPVERQHSLYMLKDGDISAIDPATGAEILHLDANIRFESPQLAVSPEAGLVAVADVLGDEDEFELGVKIYRMSDGSLERALSVPTIQRCIGGPCINLVFSQDGQRIHVQQYETQPGEAGNQADYWLGTFDLIEGKWLLDVELQACGALNHLETVGPHEVIALCAKTGLYIVDTEHFTARSAGYRFNSAAMVAHDDEFFVVYHDRTICRQARDGDRTTATCETTAKLDDTEGVAQFNTNLGVFPDGSLLYIPTATSADRGGSQASSTASTIAVISTASWGVERTIDVGFGFGEIVFSEDVSTAYVISDHEEGMAKLARIDLQTGNQTELASGAISSLVIAPRWNDERVATTPTSTPEPNDVGQLDTGADEAYFVGADGDHVVWKTPDDAIHAAAIDEPEPFTLVGESALKSSVRFDNGVVVWSEPNPNCATGCAGVYGKRIGEDETFVIAPGGHVSGTEISDAYVTISYPWVAWLRFSGRQSELLIRNIESMAEPVRIAGPSDVPLEPPVIDGERVVWMEEPNELDPSVPNRLVTKLIGDDEATLIAEGVEPLSYAVGGDLIVYADVGTDAHFAHRISTGEVVTVYDPEGDTGARPQSPVTDGRFVFWLESVPAPSGQRVEHRIRGFDVETGVTFEVAGPGIMSPSPELILNDGQIAWLYHDLEGTDTIHVGSVQSIVAD